MEADARVEAPAIEAVGLRTILGGRLVLDEVGFAAPPGSITILLGPSGVGKTTCVRHLTGLARPARGDVLIEGRSRFGLSQDELVALQRRFGVVFQGSGLHGSALFESMTVHENVGFQLRAQRDPLAAADQLRSRPDALDEGSHALVRESLREVGMLGHAEAMPEELSAGMRRRVALARAMVAEPEFLIIDGLDAGLDGVRLMKLCELIAARHERLGGTYVITTHDMEVARRLGDRLIVLWGGRVVAAGTPETVFESERPEVRQLLSGDREGPLAMGGGASGPSAQPVDEGPWGFLPDVTVRTILIVAAIALLAAAIVLLLWVEGREGSPFA